MNMNEDYFKSVSDWLDGIFKDTANVTVKTYNLNKNLEEQLENAQKKVEALKKQIEDNNIIKKTNEDTYAIMLERSRHLYEENEKLKKENEKLRREKDWQKPINVSNSETMKLKEENKKLREEIENLKKNNKKNYVESGNSLKQNIAYAKAIGAIYGALEELKKDIK